VREQRKRTEATASGEQQVADEECGIPEQIFRKELLSESKQLQRPLQVRMRVVVKPCQVVPLRPVARLR
jgi:hypothetical protein